MSSILKNIMNALFGKPFDVDIQTPTEELTEQLEKTVDSANVGDSDAILTKLNQYFSVSLDSAGRYTDYRLMEISAPEVGKALTYMASYYSGFIFINTEDKLLELQIQSLLNLWNEYLAKNHQSIYGMIRSLLKYGDLFVEPAYIKIPKKDYDDLEKRLQHIIKKNVEAANYKITDKQLYKFVEILLQPQQGDNDDFYYVLGGFKYYDPDFFEIALYIEGDNDNNLSPEYMDKIGDLFNQLQNVFDKKKSDSPEFKSVLDSIVQSQDKDFFKEGQLYILKRKLPIKPEPSRQMAQFSSSMTPMPTIYYNPSAKRLGNLRIIMGRKEMESIKRDYFVYRYNKDMYHLGIFIDLYRPYGTSLLDSARLAWKKMELLEEILILRRMMSLKRGWWKVSFPSRLSKTKISLIIQEIVNKVKRVQLADTDKQNIHSFPLLWGMTDEVIVPVISNEYDLNYEDFGPHGGEFNKEIEEYLQLRDRFYNGLYIPKNLLKSIREGEVVSADIISQDKMFKEIGKHVRQVVSMFLQNMIHNFFESRGVSISPFNIVFLQLEEIKEITDMLSNVSDMLNVQKILQSMGVETILKSQIKREG